MRTHLERFIDEVDPILTVVNRRVERSGELGLRFPEAGELPGPLTKVGGGIVGVYVSDYLPFPLSTFGKIVGWGFIVSGSVDLIRSVVGEAPVTRAVSRDVRVSAEVVAPAAGSIIVAKRRKDLILLKTEGLPFVGDWTYPVTVLLENREERPVTVSVQVEAGEFGSWMETPGKATSERAYVDLDPLESKEVTIYVPVISSVLSGIDFILDVVLSVKVNSLSVAPATQIKVKV